MQLILQFVNCAECFTFHNLYKRGLCVFLSLKITASSKVSPLIALSWLGWKISFSFYPSLTNHINLGNLKNLRIHLSSRPSLRNQIIKEIWKIFKKFRWVWAWLSLSPFSSVSSSSSLKFGSSSGLSYL